MDLSKAENLTNGSNCYLRGSVQETLWTPIANYDFPLNPPIVQIFVFIEDLLVEMDVTKGPFF